MRFPPSSISANICYRNQRNSGVYFKGAVNVKSCLTLISSRGCSSQLYCLQKCRPWHTPPLPAASPWKGASIGVTTGMPPATDMAQPHVCRAGLLKSRPYKVGSDQNEPQLYKKQGNIMQDHRKSEETAFWAGLARSLCELQLTSKARSLAPNSAENIPSAAKDNTPHAFASGLCSRTPCTWWNADKPGSYFSPSFHLFLKFEAYFGPTLVRSGKWFIFMALVIDHLLLHSL